MKIEVDLGRGNRVTVDLEIMSMVVENQLGSEGASRHMLRNLGKGFELVKGRSFKSQNTKFCLSTQLGTDTIHYVGTNMIGLGIMGIGLVSVKFCYTNNLRSEGKASELS